MSTLPPSPLVLLRSEQSGDRVSVIESTMPAGATGPPLHTHAFDEAFYVLEGELKRTRVCPRRYTPHARKPQRQCGSLPDRLHAGWFRARVRATRSGARRRRPASVGHAGDPEGDHRRTTDRRDRARLSLQPDDGNRMSAPTAAPWSSGTTRQTRRPCSGSPARSWAYSPRARASYSSPTIRASGRDPGLKVGTRWAERGAADRRALARTVSPFRVIVGAVRRPWLHAPGARGYRRCRPRARSGPCAPGCAAPARSS
jgi:hypothetical protein